MKLVLMCLLFVFATIGFVQACDETSKQFFVTGEYVESFCNSPFENTGDRLKCLRCKYVIFDFQFDIPYVDRETFEDLLTSSAARVFVVLANYALFSVENLIYFFAFLLSAFPPTNIMLAQLCYFVPTVSPFMDWVFVIPKGELIDYQLICMILRLPNLIVTLLLLALLQAHNNEDSFGARVWNSIFNCVSASFCLIGLGISLIWNFVISLCCKRQHHVDSSNKKEKKKDEKEK